MSFGPTTNQIIENAVSGQGHPNWTSHFPESVRRELMNDDLQAGRTVPWLLASVILFGICLATVTVLYCAS